MTLPSWRKRDNLHELEPQMRPASPSDAICSSHPLAMAYPVDSALTNTFFISNLIYIYGGTGGGVNTYITGGVMSMGWEVGY